MFFIIFSGLYEPTAGFAYLKYMLTVIGLTKFSGLFSLKGNVNPVLPSNFKP